MTRETRAERQAKQERAQLIMATAADALGLDEDGSGTVDGIDVRIRYSVSHEGGFAENHGAVASIPRGLTPGGFELYDTPDRFARAVQTVMTVAFFLLGYRRSIPLPGSNGRRHVDATSRSTLVEFLTPERVAVLNGVQADISTGTFGGRSFVAVDYDGPPPDSAAVVEMARRSRPRHDPSPPASAVAFGYRHGVTVPVQNVLFIMCDQLRHDALSCAGGLVDTPNIDALAGRGVRFDRAYVQGSVCGSSRMSAYTGRYVQSHGTRYNSVPLAVGEPTIGDHLRPLDVRSVLVGKTHMARDRSGLDRLRLDPKDPWTTIINQCGFEPFEREDGLVPNTAPFLFERGYNRFLLEQGYDGPNPWHTVANSVMTPEGERMSGWLLEASQHPAIIPDELSETAYMTDRAIEFIREAGDDRWCVHLSYIKPHWPYVVSEPYHRLVHRNDLPAPNRSDTERHTEHPVIRAFQRSRIGSTFSRDEVRDTVYPAYYGLVKQLDDHLGRLFRALDDLGRSDDTMVVLTSDHGDYMGDHWMGEKDWLHEEVVRVPMIVADPRAAADVTRGSTSDDLVEMIDLAPTFVDALGGDAANNVHLEGQSLEPLLHASATDHDQAAVTESEFSLMEMANELPPGPRTSRRATMLRTPDFKYILSETGPNLLYDLNEEPAELTDRIDDPALAAVRAELHERLFEWYRARSHELTWRSGDGDVPRYEGQDAVDGVLIGYWDESDVPADALPNIG